MSKSTDERIQNARLLRKMHEELPPTIFETLAMDAYEALGDQRDAVERDYRHRLANPDDSMDNMDFYHATSADVSSRLAMAEQQRIANLIALAVHEHTLNHSVEATALREMARKGLGLDHD